MDELQELLKQRSEINAKIKQLQDRTKICGCVKLDSFRGWGIDNGYQIFIKSFAPAAHSRWRSVVQGRTKNEMILGIDCIMKNLATLKARIEEDSATEFQDNRR